MANLTRFNPFNELARVDPFTDFGNFFRGFPMAGALRNMQAEPQMRVDVTEEDKAYKIKAEIPGVRKEDIQLSVDGNRVSISAELKEEKEEKEGSKVLRSERYYGQISRSFSLDEDVDPSGAEAKYNDGVLQVTLPKKQGGSNRKISVA